MKARKIPRGTFLLGSAVAVALGTPLTAAALAALARAGVGDPAMPFARLAALALVFAGLPALLTGGGAARLAAHRTAENAGSVPPSLRRAVLTAAAAMGAAGMGLAILVAVPVGETMPEAPWLWAPVAGAGLVAGVLTGCAIGLLVGIRQRRHHARSSAAAA